MIEPNDILGRRNEIKGYVADADLIRAVNRCIDFFRDFKIEEDDEPILISHDLKLIIAKEKEGGIKPLEAFEQKKFIAQRILFLTKDFSNIQSRTW